MPTNVSGTNPPLCMASFGRHKNTLLTPSSFDQYSNLLSGLAIETDCLNSMTRLHIIFLWRPLAALIQTRISCLKSYFSTLHNGVGYGLTVHNTELVTFIVNDCLMSYLGRHLFLSTFGILLAPLEFADICLSFPTEGVSSLTIVLI